LEGTVGEADAGLSLARPAPPGTGAFVSTGVGETATTAGARVGGGAIRARIASTSALGGLSLVPTSVTVRDGA
jgi:hypothetical protein